MMPQLPSWPTNLPSREYDIDRVVTGVFAGVTAVAVAFEPLQTTYAVLCVVALIAGCVAFLWAFGLAVQSSRYVEISVANLYMLTGPTDVAARRCFHTLTGLQIVIGVVAASLRPFTPVAFGILVPMFGLGIGGLWAARNVAFPPRAVAGAAATTPSAEAKAATNAPASSPQEAEK